MTNKFYDVIVCGGGIQGLWTTHYLAERNKNVLLLEQFPVPHTRGSSHGPSRITRYSYIDRHYAMMMPEAFKRWNELEMKTSSKLFLNSGVLSLLTEEDAQPMLKCLSDLSISYEIFQPSEIKQRFPGLIVNNNFIGIYEKSGGILKADQCIKSLQESILSFGGKIHDGEKVIKITPVSKGEVVVTTNKGSYRSKSMVLTCGPWTQKVLTGLDLNIPITPTRICVAYWKAKNPVLYQANKKFPALIFYEKDHIYSTPIMEYPDLMKVCCHTGPIIDPDQRDCYDSASFDLSMKVLKSSIKKHFPNLIPEPAVLETCIYSVTPDKDCILDCHPQHKNIIVGAGFSGSGFKISPVVGRILGQLALHEEVQDEIGTFSLQRFKAISHL
ncbi:unnamed protein product [Clavelina lepadiformis]|uniref:FAD dependent oxidoreductase domain-containing protein n=1 Tax=Clavelina lepadiformis TaxID=159417 RepID=A0ABP0GWY8_CLALP